GSGVTVNNSTLENAFMYFEAIDSVADGVIANQSGIFHTGNRSTIRNLTGENGSEIQINAGGGETLTARNIHLTGSNLQLDSDNAQVLVEDALVSNTSNSLGQSVLSSGSNNGQTILRKITVEDNSTVGVRHQVNDGGSHRLYVEDSIIRNNADSGVVNN